MRVTRTELFIEFFLAGTFLVLAMFSKYGLFEQSIIDSIVLGLSMLLPIYYFSLITAKYLLHGSINKLARNDLFSILVFFSLLEVQDDITLCSWIVLAHIITTLVKIFICKLHKSSSTDNALSQNQISPPKLVFLSFFFLIMIGTFLLMLTVSSAHPNSVTFADAIFMSASAVSTTGLATISLSGDLSFFGRMVILFLVQIGALGLMTFYSFIVLFTRQTMDLKNKLLLMNILDSDHVEDVLNLVYDIVLYTFVIEFWGAILLAIGFACEGMDFTTAIYHGIYHSISAFCTAGFSTFENSLESYKTNFLINATTSILCVLGALGFIVLQECRLFFLKKEFTLSLHSKVVLTANGLFFLFGTAFLFFNEYTHSLDTYGLFNKIQIAFFQFMTTTTTAGFNTIPIGDMQSTSLFFLIPIMFIGGAPGSTAGGIKITTFVVLLYSIKSFFHPTEKIKIFNRTIPYDIVIKSIAVALISLIFVLLFLLILMIFENQQSFLSVMFEVMSSFGTVGISAGITAYLSSAGKVALAFLMFIARIGPLALVLTIGSHDQNRVEKVNYPIEPLHIV